MESSISGSESPGFGGSASWESSPGFGGSGSPGFGGSRDSLGGPGRESPGFGGSGSPGRESPGLGGSGSQGLGGSAGPVRESPEVDVVDGIVYLDLSNLSNPSNLSDLSNDSNRTVVISSTDVPFSWDGLTGAHEESMASLRFYDGILRGMAPLTGCEVVQSQGLMNSLVLTLKKDGIRVSLTTIQDTIESRIMTYVRAKVFIAPVGAMRGLLLDGDRNALQNIALDDPTILRGACLDIPDIPVQMHRHAEIVDGEIVVGVNIVLPPTFFGDASDKFLAYVFGAA